MAGTSVFVDDAVQGHLPMVCARTGAPADGLHRIHRTFGGGSPWAFLLIFFGPIGWLVLLVTIALAGRSRELVVRLPYSHDALATERGQFRAAVAAGSVLLGATAVATVLLFDASRGRTAETLLLLAGIVGAAAAVVTAVLAARYTSARPGIDLDASGRWVTLRRVHPAFAAAVDVRKAAATRPPP
jgi:hypothetical protein